VQAAKRLKKSMNFPWMELTGDVAKISEGMGAHAERVEKPEAIRGALERALAAKEPAVVEVLTMVGAPEAH
jgi:thiamine pyrophosphate-dependent acetolactate synthase large subunit-like protein